MNSKKVIMAISALTMLLSVGGILISRALSNADNDNESSTPPHVDTREARAKLVELRDRIELEKLKMNMNELSRDVFAMKGIVAKSGMDDAAEIRQNAVSSERAARGGVVLSSTVSEKKTAYHERFIAEPVDGAWAKRMEVSLLSLLEKDTFSGSHMTQMACHTTLCEMHITHDNEDSRDSFSDLFSMDAPSNQEIALLPGGNDTDGYETVCYLSRPGHFITQTVPVSPGDLPISAVRARIRRGIDVSLDEDGNR